MAAEPVRSLIVALDTDRLSLAKSLVARLRRQVRLFKVGSQLFTAEGPRAVQELARFGAGIFLDLKFHDIPNTVAGAVSGTAALPGVRLITVHALGGLEMMSAARRALPASPNRPELLAVTVLTSHDAASLRRVGIARSPAEQVIRLARLAQQAGLDGVVASPREVAAIRRACGKNFLIVVPGVRPSWAIRGDQARVATPAETIRAGADYLVVGRPITAARDPRAAANRILDEISGALV